MSHSRIFQYSIKPIDEDNYIDDMFMTSDYIWYAFQGKFCGDYVDTRTVEERIEDIEWLETNLSKFNIKLEGEDKFILGKGFKQSIQNFWYYGIQNCFEALDKEDMVKYHDRWHLKYAITDPLSGGFGFLFYNNEEQTLTASDDFFEFLLRLNEGDTFYIGATLDYHC